VLDRLQGHPLYEIIVLDLATGMRRGELLALRLSDVDLDRATVRIERSLEETREGLRFKPPKTGGRGRRTISLPADTVAVLREHRRKLLELRMALDLGKPDAGTLLFAEPDGSPRRPDQLSWLWRFGVQVAQVAHGVVPRPASHARFGVDCCRARRRPDQSTLRTQEPQRYAAGLWAHVQAQRPRRGGGDRGRDENEERTMSAVIGMFRAQSGPNSSVFSIFGGAKPFERAET
jgi:hypothetical protein